MAATKLLFNQARRQCLYRIQTQSQLRLPPFLSSFTKSFSSSSDEVSIKQAASVPKTQPHEEEEPNLQSAEPGNQDSAADSATSEVMSALTREDVRYVRNAASITPVAYPVRVAPLPEFKAPEEVQGGDAATEEVGGEVERELKKIDESGLAVNMRRRVFRVLEEEVTVPFPMLVKAEKKQKPAPFDLMDAIRSVKANAKSNFDETIEAHVRLGVDPKRSDLIVRGSVLLPHSLGKVVRVAFFASGEDADEARAAGAEVVGGEELIEEIAKSGGKVNFDKCYTTPQFMPRIGKLGRILGPRGLMPTAKQGLVSSNIAGAVKEAKKGLVSFRMDKSSIVHVGLGKASLPEDYLRENICAFVNSILLAKPAGLKKTSKYAGYVNSFHICSTMGSGYPVSIQSISKAVDTFTKATVK